MSASIPDDERMTVTVKAFGGLRELAPSSAITVSLPLGTTVADLLVVLHRRIPALHEKLETGLADGYINILLNGRNVRFLDGLRTRLPAAAGATIAFLPPIGGG